MCAKFSAMNNINFAKLSDKEVMQQLKPALDHFKFATRPCEIQRQQGGLFMFEHPSKATSWEIKMIKDIMKKPGVQRVECLISACWG